MRYAYSLVAVAVLNAACGDEGAKRVMARPEAAGNTSVVGTVISLRGCIASAPGTDHLALTTIQVDLPGQTPGDPGRSAARSGITEWSWVKLDPGEHDLTRYRGERIHVTGVITESGRNTIGTAGTWGYEVPSGDESQAGSDAHHAVKQKLEMGRIARQSMANGTAATIRAEEVRSTGHRCAG